MSESDPTLRRETEQSFQRIAEFLNLDVRTMAKCIDENNRPSLFLLREALEANSEATWERFLKSAHFYQMVELEYPGVPNSLRKEIYGNYTPEVDGREILGRAAADKLIAEEQVEVQAERILRLLDGIQQMGIAHVAEKDELQENFKAEIKRFDDQLREVHTQVNIAQAENMWRKEAMFNIDGVAQTLITLCAKLRAPSLREELIEGLEQIRDSVSDIEDFIAGWHENAHAPAFQRPELRSDRRAREKREKEEAAASSAAQNPPPAAPAKRTSKKQGNKAPAPQKTRTKRANKSE